MDVKAHRDQAVDDVLDLVFRRTFLHYNNHCNSCSRDNPISRGAESSGTDFSLWNSASVPGLQILATIAKTRWKPQTEVSATGGVTQSSFFLRRRA
jgi:hypothetical protein